MICSILCDRAGAAICGAILPAAIPDRRRPAGVFCSIDYRSTVYEARPESALAGLYFIGSGTHQDLVEAVRWYRKAAAQNNALAQNQLGLMYDEGRGVVKDQKEAVKWYRLAAAQNLAVAQYNLGRMYEDGTGVVKNEKEANDLCAYISSFDKDGKKK